MRRASTALGSLEEVKNDHNKDNYPHFHHVLSRKRPSITIEKEKPRKGKIITEAIASLPTIEDTEVQDEPLEKSSPWKFPNISKESPEKTLSELHHDADVEEVNFTIGSLQTDEELVQERRLLEQKARIKRRKKKKTSKRRSSKFSEDELRMRSFRGSELSREGLEVCIEIF